jgi:hypothetical protein
MTTSTTTKEITTMTTKPPLTAPPGYETVADHHASLLRYILDRYGLDAVAAALGLAVLHKGERVIPASEVVDHPVVIDTLVTTPVLPTAPETRP